MNSSQDLLPEDRAEYERILDEALRRARERPEFATLEFATPESRLTAEQLRTMALDASAAISARAADEYRHYREVRGAGESGRPGAAGSTEATGESAGGAEGPEETEGPGMIAMFSVLAPVLAAVAAVLFLLTGYVLRAVGPDESAASSLIGVGWVFVALTGGAMVLAMAGLLVTALRHGSASVGAASSSHEPEEVVQARDAWRLALLERGVYPFLRDALAAAGPVVRNTDGAYGGAPEHARRMPDLGYSRPDFSSPGAAPGEALREDARPSFNSPGYSSPDYGGPEHDPA